MKVKIQCDVCNKNEASVYCSADEASLCATCDHRVHHANKLAGKHHRFSLLQPSPKQAPLCDICQEKEALLFCQQDRAILCTSCDIRIHKANEFLQKHNRFVITGVKLISVSLSDGSDEKLFEEPVFDTPLVSNPPSISNMPKITTEKDGRKKVNEVGDVSTSSISEYLIETLPGWHVEELLDFTSTPGFIRGGENDLISFWDADVEGNMGCLSSENMGILVPQAPPVVQPCQSISYPVFELGFGGTFDLEQATNMGVKSSSKWRDNGCFDVPRIKPPSTTCKRSRTLW